MGIAMWILCTLIYFSFIVAFWVQSQGLSNLDESCQWICPLTHTVDEIEQKPGIRLHDCVNFWGSLQYDLVHLVFSSVHSNWCNTIRTQ